MMNSNPTTKARLQDNLLGNGLPTPPCSVRQTRKLSMVISSTTEQVYASIDITDISLHEGVGFSIHSLNRTGSPCLLGCHDYVAACAGARAQNVCALNIPCLRPHAIQYLLYYCAFKCSTINICVWGGAAKGHLAKRRSCR